jgi:hypothetical protein
MTVDWDGNRASNGTALEERRDGYAVRLPEGGLIEFCPCCNRPFSSAEKARTFVGNMHILYGEHVDVVLGSMVAKAG